MFTTMRSSAAIDLIIFLTLAKGQTECDFDYVCDDAGSPEDLAISAPSPLACYRACKASQDANGDCPFWTYYEELGPTQTFHQENENKLENIDERSRANGKPVCRRLTTCDSIFPRSSCGSTVNGAACASGPGSCEACDMCPRLNYGPGDAVAHWTCDIHVPYRKHKGLPHGTVCRTECPSMLWTVDGTTPGSIDSPVAVKSTCQSDCGNGGPTGLWVLEQEDATFNQNGDKPTPTLDAPCLCENIVLGPHQVPSPIDATTMEDGAKFYCNSPGLIDNNTTMDSAARCQLFCNGHIAMDIKCNGGYWSEGVKSNEDIYCWGTPHGCEYNPGINMDVCTCSNSDGDKTVVCTPRQGCHHGVCLDACLESENELGEDCFCESQTGGTTCISGQICNHWTCTPK